MVLREQDPAQVFVVDEPEGPARASRLGPAPWIASGVAVAALAGAAVSAFLRASALSDLDAACGPSRKS